MFYINLNLLQMQTVLITMQFLHSRDSAVMSETYPYVNGVIPTTIKCINNNKISLIINRSPLPILNHEVS